MVNLEELRQLVAFAECGRLSKAAEKLYISQPTITRTMQHLEEEFAVPLFERTKNSISLNPTGREAVEYSRALLKDAEKLVKDVRDFDRRQHTITISSAAPAPLWRLLPALSSEFPGKTLSSSVKDEPEVLSDLMSGECILGVLTYPPDGLSSIPFLEERLSIAVTPGHALAGYENVSFNDINGFNFLLAGNLGFWERLCRERMPSSRFHVQASDLAMAELTRESSLPCFVTDLSLGRRGGNLDGRLILPISDPEADVTYYLAHKGDKTLEDAIRRIMP